MQQNKNGSITSDYISSCSFNPFGNGEAVELQLDRPKSVKILIAYLLREE